ncbi:hypothetical protein BDV33DRAFT_211233 [Aspergillus novoparasiticus]|uniref:Secreted protein n=1 Tax=Aspergillus novoparasiticus TaxID=986946 RepID=A0A5N6E823_9EURO|nr:hypothetical protein BDV33DRAFT_211233 [Aspergillus novoparasiticus]
MKVSYFWQLFILRLGCSVARFEEAMARFNSRYASTNGHRPTSRGTLNQGFLKFTSFDPKYGSQNFGIAAQ